MSASVADVQVSCCTMLISSPTNFLANDGIPVGGLDLVDA